MRRIGWVADLLSRNGVVAVVAAVAPYRAAREEVRAVLGERFLEVHVRASIDDLRAARRQGALREGPRGRDRALHRGLRSLRGAALGELTLDTERDAPQESAERLVELVEERLGRRQAAPV